MATRSSFGLLAFGMFEKLAGHEGPDRCQALVAKLCCAPRFWLFRGCLVNVYAAHVRFFSHIVAGLGAPSVTLISFVSAVTVWEPLLLAQEKKLELLAAAHKDSGHMGGRDAILRALREQGVTWPYLKYDATWVVAKCQQCASRTTRNLAAPVCRQLPRPLAAGDVVGVDLKTVTPPSGERWCMLVLRDYTSGRVWAWDLDDDKQLGMTPLQ